MRTDPSKSIPRTDATAEMWVSWHKSLRKWFSKVEANEHWLRFWNQRGGASSDADTYALREYMEAQGVNITTTTMGQITNGTMAVVEWGTSTINWVRGLAIGGIILGMGLIAFYIIYSTSKGKSANEMALDIGTIGKGKGAKRLGSRKGIKKATARVPAPNPAIDMNRIDFMSANSQNALTGSNTMKQLT